MAGDPVAESVYLGVFWLPDRLELDSALYRAVWKIDLFSGDRRVASERPSYVAKTASIPATSITSPGSSCFWPPSTTISFTLILTLFSEAAMK
jgi:hypothetical protein